MKRGNKTTQKGVNYAQSVRNLEVTAILMMYELTPEMQHELESMLNDCGVSILEE